MQGIWFQLEFELEGIKISEYVPESKYKLKIVSQIYKKFSISNPNSDFLFCGQNGLIFFF